MRGAEEHLQRRRKLLYYVRNGVLYVVPDSLYTWFHTRRCRQLTDSERNIVKQRTNYYLRLPSAQMSVYDERVTSKTIETFRFPFGKPHKERHSAYFFDLYETLRCLPKQLLVRYIFDDVAYEPLLPAIVKSRPIVQGTTNGVLCKLNKIRHYRFVDDTVPWVHKRDMLVMRNVVQRQPWRTDFIRMYRDHPMCDVGQVNSCAGHPEYVRPRMSLAEQLQYKFVACIEGHDVSTNLKWVMSSNSLAVMPRPRIESWFMEGTLVGNYHYVEIKSDYSDLEEKMNYYISHPSEAQRIIDNAHEYVKQFQNERLESVIQYNVVKRFLEKINR